MTLYGGEKKKKRVHDRVEKVALKWSSPDVTLEVTKPMLTSMLFRTVRACLTDPPCSEDSFSIGSVFSASLASEIFSGSGSVSGSVSGSEAADSASSFSISGSSPSFGNLWQCLVSEFGRQPMPTNPVPLARMAISISWRSRRILQKRVNVGLISLLV